MSKDEEEVDYGDEEDYQEEDVSTVNYSI